MSNDNEEGRGFCGCVILIVLILFITSYCTRYDPERIIDNSIEQVHESWDHVDSVWKGGNK